MSTLWQVDRSATIAFCPVAPFIAAGTVAGAIDVSFSTNAVLEIFPTDVHSLQRGPHVAGSVTVPERFNRTAWGPKFSDGTTLQMGLLAGGLADGSIIIWDPSIMLSKTDGNAVLAKMQKHTGGVKGLEFNQFSPNLLASGATEGELCIWDLANPTQPSLYPALKAGGSGPSGSSEITYLSWNRKVQQIVASTSTNGSTVVWDLKRQRPVISFKEPNSQRRCSVLQWNPEVATQLIVASDDDRSPTLQMWDLRNSVSPLKEFVGHSKGVLGMAWSQHDPSLLLSSAKDNRTICWDIVSGDIMAELPASNYWNYDVQWCPTVPGMFATCSFDGKISVHNLNSCTTSSVVETVNADFSVTTVPGDSTPLRKAPAWMKRPCGAAFGFGGKLVSFVNQRQQVSDSSGQVRFLDNGVVNITQIVTENELVQRSEEFEKAIAGGDRGVLREFCGQKTVAIEGDEKETWSFLSVMFEDDCRRQLLARLGFGDALQQLQSHTSVNNMTLNTVTSNMDELNLQDGVDLTNDLGVDFGVDLGMDLGVDLGRETPRSMTQESGMDLSNDREEEIQKAIFVGNYEAAVDICFKAGRVADALLIANIGGSDLYKRAMHRYMKQHPHPYMQVVSAMIDNDYMSLVKTRTVARWKETLAVLATYSGADQWPELCNSLAQRLAHAGMHHAASLCYVCAGNVDQAVVYWTKACGETSSVDTLQGVIEKSVVMGLATNNKKASPSLSELVTSYASLLAAQGRMSTALEYLDLVPGEASSTVAILRDRIYRSGTSGLPGHVNPPPFPFVMEEVHPAAEVAAAGSTAMNQTYTQQYGMGAQQNQYAAGQANYTYSAPTAQPQPTYGAQPAYAANANQYPAAAATQYNTQPAYGAQGQYAAGQYANASQTYPSGTQAAAYPAATPTQQYNAAPAAGYGSGGYQQSTQQQAGYNYSNASYGYTAPAYVAPPQEGQGQVYQVKRTNTLPSGGVPAAPAPPAAVAAPAAPAPQAYQPAAPAAPTQNVTTVATPNFFVPAASPAPVAPAYNAAVSAQAMPPAAQPVAPAPPPPPPAPVGPPANVSLQNVDTSKVAPEQRPVIASLNNLFNSCVPLVNNPAKRKEMDDNSKRLGQMLWKLNAGEVSPHVVQKLMQLCQSLDAGDLATASHIQVELTTSDWDECGQWLTALKRLIKMRQGF